MMARPTLLTPEIHKKIVDAVASGNYQTIAAKWAGVSPRTMQLWMHKGRKGEEPYAGFMRAVREAEYAAHIRAVAVIYQAGQTDPKMMLAWLERKFPDWWGREVQRIRELEKQVNEVLEILKAQGVTP